MKTGSSSGVKHTAILWIAVAVFILIVRFLYVFEYSSSLPFLQFPVVDAQVYDEWAKELASGHWVGEEVFYRAPLYPYLLGAAYSIAGVVAGRVAVVTLQILLGLTGIFLIFRTGSRLLGRSAAGAAVLLFSFYAPPLFFETKLLPAAMGLFLQIATLWSLALAWDRGRPWDFLRSGLLGGLYALTRPTALLFLILVLMFGAVMTRRRQLPAPRWTWAWLVAGAFLVIAPVTLRNRIVGNDWVLISSNAGVTFYHGNNEENRSGLMSVPTKLRSDASAIRQEALETHVAEREAGRTLKPSERSRYWLGQGLSFWKDSPGRGLELVSKKLIKSLGPHEFPNNYSLSLERKRLKVIDLLPMSFSILLVLGSLGALWLPKSGGARSLLLAAVITGLVANLVFFVTSRYRLEMIPALSLLAGYGLVEGYRRIRGGRFPRMHLLVPALLIIPSFIPPGMGMNSQESIMWVQLGGILKEKGQVTEAEEAFSLAVDLYPPGPMARAHLALALAEQGRTSEAAGIVQPALSAPAAPAFAFYVAGIVRETSGDLRGAEAALREALRRAPAMASAHRALLRVVLRQDRHDEARTNWGPPAIPRSWSAERVDELLEWTLAQRVGAADSLAIVGPTDAEMRILVEILP